jgi:hypothetical protein
MTAHLSLVQGEARSAPPFDPPPLLLDERTQRPGELASPVVVEVPSALGVRLDSLARGARLPVPLFARIAVEAARALDELTSVLEPPDAEAVAALLDTAAEPNASGFEPPPARALRVYARALCSGGATARRGSPSDLTLIVSDRLRARWSLAAQAEGLALEAWIASKLERARGGCERWEAQAAFDGQTLGEWVMLQALRRARRSSSSAQASA